MRFKILYAFVLTIVFACNESPGTKKETDFPDKQLIGEWNNLSIKIDIHSKNNSDSNEVFEVNRPEWEERLKIKPIRSFFREDSTWNSAHYNLKDSLVYNPSGKWWIENEKLVMLQQKPSPDTTQYSFVINKDTATFECMLDWDMDGKKDDFYSGKQIKISK